MSTLLKNLVKLIFENFTPSEIQKKTKVKIHFFYDL